MKKPTGQEDYRSWCERGLVDLPLYWQPQWLDIVNPTWEASCENDDWTNPGWVWPYSYEKYGPFKIIKLPDCTPYLGPVLVDKKSYPPMLPNEVTYGIFTFFQPALNFAYKDHARAMATCILDLSEQLSYATSLKQRIKAGQKVLRPKQLDESDFFTLEKLITSKAALNPKRVNAIMQRAQNQGIGELWGILNDNGELEAAAGILVDKKCAYMPFSVRKDNPNPNANPLLYHTLVNRAQALGKETFDFTGGYLPGSRKFFESFGAKASWYGQARIARGILFRSLEAIRKRTNSKRI